jgi:Transposase-associated domain
MDHSRWMYVIRRDTIEYLRGVEEFMDYVIEDMSQKSDQTIIFPCRDYPNLRD